MAETSFDIIEATIDEIHRSYESGLLTSRALVQQYVDRIEAYDRNGPMINSVLHLSATVFKEADALDARFRETGRRGPLHGIPVMIKDQCDVAGMPTTMGSVLFKDYYPDKDSFVVQKLRKAGALILGKATLGELAGGDTHGSLFGSTLNPYDLERTAGGSSGGSAACVTANFCAVAVGLEGFASIRRPAAWNAVVGMRPTAGLVSRSGVYNGWPLVNGSLGPMCRTVADTAKLLDVMVGYDPEDPLTARGVPYFSGEFTRPLGADALQGSRLGVLRESIGFASEPNSEDFKKVDEVFERTIVELKAAGATLIDAVVIPDLKALLEKRSSSFEDEEASFAAYFGRSKHPPFKTREEALRSPNFAKVRKGSQERLTRAPNHQAHYGYLRARDELMTRMLKVMADHNLDAIVHKAVEHQPTLIRDGVRPPYVDLKGAPHINTFLVFVPSIVVPAGFTRDNLPVGITFLGRPYDDAKMIALARSYERLTNHRRPPETLGMTHQKPSIEPMHHQ
jgi:Asp-tRNA(Asn)/Glu-tRNA(Gln) amidotransferase A subunit family amidase